MEYEILERAFAKAGQDLEEARKSKELLASQLDGVEREREALAARVRSLEALAASRLSDTAAQAANARGHSTLLAERDAALAASSEDLRLERDIVQAVRQQVGAAEAERLASAARIEVLRTRLAEAGGLPHAGDEDTHGATGEASWEALLHEQVRALEEALAGRDAELSTVRAQLDGSRKEVRRLHDESPLLAAREAAAVQESRLRAELAATQADLEAKAAEASAANASAALMRSRLAEQAHWVARRDDQLASLRREGASLREELQAAHAEGQAVRIAASGEDGSGGGDGGGGVTGLSALARAEDAARVAALEEKLATLEGSLSSTLATSSQRLAEEAHQTQTVHGELQAAQQALTAARAEAAEATGALRRAESRCASLDGERRTKQLEVARLSAELGAMSSRLQASAQEVRSTDQLAVAIRAQREGGERELVRLRDDGRLRDDLNAQLKEALARESERVAKAWEQREALHETLRHRDDALERTRADLASSNETLAAARDELEQHREQRRLAEILLRGAEERSSLRQHAIAAGKEESARLAAEVSGLQARLTALQDGELRHKELELQRAKETLTKQELSTESRDERVALLTVELAARSEEILSLRVAVGQRDEALKAQAEGPVAALHEQLATATSEARLAHAQRDDALEANGRLQKTLDRKALEVHARGEQLRLSHESALLLTLEATLKDERMQSLDESLHVERTRNEREATLLRSLRTDHEKLADSTLALTKQLASERERGSLLELRLAQRDEQASSLIEELRSAEARGDGRETRLRILQTRAAVSADERELFDTRLTQLHTRMNAHEDELAEAREERMMLLAEATKGQADAEARRAEAHGLRVTLRETESRLIARDEQVRDLPASHPSITFSDLPRLIARDGQLAATNARLAAAREDLDVQLAMVQEEVRGAQIRVEAKDIALDLQLEEALGREQQAHGFMKEVGERLRKAREAMSSKDDLLAALQAKLQASVGALRGHELGEIELKQQAASDRRAKDAAVGQLARLEERHELVQADFDAASEALDGYRESLVQAEVRMREDRERMGALQRELREMHQSMAPGATPTGAAPFANALPPLGALAAGADVGSSRVHFLYFLSSFLLLKTALSSEGRMANVAAQDVFDEIVRNEVPLEEWPTYIFTRVYQQEQRSSLYDSEMAALKAVAKHADARKVPDDAPPLKTPVQPKPAPKGAAVAAKKGGVTIVG